MVYVKSIDGKPLMPTSNAKARKLLKQKKAKVVSLRPFVVKLTYKTKTEYTQKLNLGVDSGYSNIGFSVIDAKQELVLVIQDRLKNRSLEKFYDSKIIDIRTEKKVSGGDLNCGRSTRNKNLNTENLRKYRGVKISKGQRRIRKQKYFYQPNDLVKYDGKVYTVKGTQNEGKYIALKEIKKVPKVELLIPYVFKKGLNWSYGLC